MTDSRKEHIEETPQGELFLRTVAMPADANPAGDIFGGWLLAQMDLAAGSLASQRSRGRTATIAIDAMKFHRPVLIGDEISCYARILRIGRTSLTIEVETWTRQRDHDERIKVTEGRFTFVAIDELRHPRPVEGN